MTAIISRRIELRNFSMFFSILQILFDAVLLFSVLFLFHFTAHQIQRKKEENDILKNLQVQEIKDQLQELLMTLKQLGKEVSDDIQEQVREAEIRTEQFKKIIAKLQRDIKKTILLSEEVNEEKIRLEEKINIIQTAKKKLAKASSRQIASSSASPTDEKKNGVSPSMVGEIYRMADADMDLNEIAKKTQLTQGEIQLILNLRGNRFTTPN